MAEWKELTELTGGRRFVVERVRLTDMDVAIEGKFELPPLSCLTMEDQIFVAAFVKCHGSIREMEKLFGVSYPSIKNRLNRIGKELDFAEVSPLPARNEILEDLAAGTIDTDEAIRRLRQC